jgi:hypothetical protein
MLNMTVFWDVALNSLAEVLHQDDDSHCKQRLFAFTALTS